MNHLPAENQQGQHYEQRGQRGQQRARKGFVDGLVHHRYWLGLAQLAEVLPHPVEHDDGIVEGVADDRQHGRQYRQGKIQLEQRKHPDRDQDIMHQGHHRAHGKTPFEPQGDIDQDSNQGIQHGKTALFLQFIPNLGADEFHPAHLHGTVLHYATAVAELVSGSGLLGQDLAGGPSERLHHRGTELRRLDLLPLHGYRESDQHIPGGAEVLDDGILESSFGQRRTYALDFHRIAVAHFHQGAAGEIDAEVQAADRNGADAHHQDNHGHDHRQPAPAEKIDIGISDELEFHDTSPVGPLYQQLPDILAPVIPVHQHPRQQDGSEHGGQDADTQRHRKALDGPGAEIEQHHGGDERGHIGVHDGGQGLVIAKVDTGLGGIAVPQLLPDSLEYQDVGVHRHAHRQHDAGDPR